MELVSINWAGRDEHIFYRVDGKWLYFPYSAKWYDPAGLGGFDGVPEKSVPEHIRNAIPSEVYLEARLERAT